jgi:Tol biopolymer transport system component
LRDQFLGINLRINTVHIKPLLTLALAGLVCQPCRASVVEFSNKSAWQAAVDNYSTITFAELPEFTWVTTQYSPLGVTFTDGSDQIHYSPSYLNDHFGLNGALDTTWIEFSQPMNWIAADFPGSLQFQLYSRGNLVYVSSNLGGSGKGRFGGLVSDVPFDQVFIVDPSGGLFIDDLFFGSAVPVPSGILLFVTAAVVSKRLRTSRARHNKPLGFENCAYGCVLIAVLLTTSGQSFAQTTYIASVSLDGVPGNFASTEPSVSADGRFIAFASGANNLVMDDTHPPTWGWDIFVRDTQLLQTTRVSVSSEGAQTEWNSLNLTPAISGDGHFVAFMSTSSKLIPDDVNGKADIYVHDRYLATTYRISVSTTGQEANAHCTGTALNNDGRYVVFESDASTLVPLDANGVHDVFLHDQLTQQTTRISVTSEGNEASNASSHATISGDGRCIAFQSLAEDLVDNDANNLCDVFVHDRLTGEVQLVSVTSIGEPANGVCVHPSISADGRFVAFSSSATNLSSGDNNGFFDVFVHDRLTHQTTMVSLSTTRTQGNAASLDPKISGDGRYVAFNSRASNFILGDTNGWDDIFVRDRLIDATWVASVSSGGVLGNGPSTLPSISADGQSIGFESSSYNFVPGIIPNSSNMRQAYVRNGPCLACPTCIADVIPNGVINVGDLLWVIDHWGTCALPPPNACFGDVNGDGFINGVELLAILNEWGPCRM